MSDSEFNTLVLSHSDGLKPFAISLTRDLEAAKDLYQQTLYKALVYRGKYEHGTNITGWLYTIMRNIFINEYRRNGRKKLMVEAIKYSQNQYTASSETGLRQHEINNAIEHLPFIFKTAFMPYLQGYKYYEIALALNEPLGTIKSRIHFAKKLLQKQLDR